MSRIDHPLGRHRQPTEQLDQPVAVDRQVGGLADAHIVERRTRHETELVRPNMRIDVRVQLHPGRLDARHRVRWRRLDPIDLTGQQGRQPGRRIGHAAQDQPVRFRHPLRVPIGGIAAHLRTLPRDHLFHDPRPGAGRGHRDLVPVAAHFLPAGRARHVEIDRLIREHRVGGLVDDLHGHLIDHAIGRDGANPRPGLSRLGLVELRRGPVQQLVEVPDHRLGRELAAVVERYAGAQLEGPDGLGFGIDLPAQSQSGLQLGGDIVARQIPVDQRIVQRHPNKPLPLPTLARLPGRQRNIRQRHRHAQGPSGLGPRDRGQQPNRRGTRQSGSARNQRPGHAISFAVRTGRFDRQGVAFS